MSPIRVLIADDHALFRRGVASLLAAESAFELVGEAPDGAQAVEMARELMPEKKEPQKPVPQVPMQPGPMQPTPQMPMQQPPQMPMQPAPQMPMQQAPRTPMQKPITMGETKVVVPNSVKDKWSAVKLIVEDKVKKESKEYTANLNSDLKIPDSNLEIYVGEFLPDFKMQGLTLTSASNEPKNPAVAIRVIEE